MTKILVTGATGSLGRQTLNFLLKRVSPAQIATLARDPAKLADLAARGVDVRQGDYHDRASLEATFKGIDRLFFISAPSFTNMVEQHRNIVAAATAAGVPHIVYTGIQRREGSGFVMDQVTATENATEEMLAASGAGITVLRNATYMDALPFLLGPKALNEIRVPAGKGASAFVARRDLGEASAVVLSTEGHIGKTYTLTGGVAVTMDEIAAILSQIAGHTVRYTDVSVATFIEERVAAGLPEPVGVFLASWMQAIAAGEFATVSGDLERLIGHPAVTPAALLPTLFATA
jgi:NAD(P)H dehydrogenase (quinone)